MYIIDASCALYPQLDKLASKRNKHGGKDIGGEGVQQSLLKIIEGTTVTVTDKAKNKTYQVLSLCLVKF